jgi:PilZ domain
MRRWVDDGGHSRPGGLVAWWRWLAVPSIGPKSVAGAAPRAGVVAVQRGEIVPDPSEVRYLVLADRAVPYLLARVRWPDVAQALSAASPDWIEDPGLFDLPYDPSAVSVSFAQAASVAAGWGTRIRAETAEEVPPYIRRMPANWSDLSPSERRTWGIDFVGRPRGRARLIAGLRPRQAKIAGSSAAAPGYRQAGALARLGGNRGVGIRTQAANGNGRPGNGLAHVASEHRGQMRVRLVGRAHIRCEHTTFTAGLVDLSERGVQCVLPEAPPLVAPGAMLGGPFLLEAEVGASRICLDVAGQISWHRSNGAGTQHFGVAFGELANGETEGVQRLLAAAGGSRGRR